MCKYQTLYTVPSKSTRKCDPKMMSKMRCNSASLGGVIFYISVPKKKLIQPFTAAEATKQVETKECWTD